MNVFDKILQFLLENKTNKETFKIKGFFLAEVLFDRNICVISIKSFLSTVLKRAKAIIKGKKTILTVINFHMR